MDKQKLTFVQRAKISIVGFLEFLWNSETKEFMGRDGASWAKISFFYAIFYAILGSCFIGMLAVLSRTLDPKVPTYTGISSIMAYAKDFESGRKSVNPGLGYRPQLDPESSLILYSTSQLNDSFAAGDFLRLNRSLQVFFDHYYTTNENNTKNEINDCVGQNIDEIRKELREGKYCKYDWKEVINYDNQGSNDTFGYLDEGPLVVLKLNRIYNWLPKSYSLEDAPDFVKDLAKNNGNKENIENILKENVIVRCEGERAFDKDNLNRMKITYNSKSGVEAQQYKNSFGVLPFVYYPYLNQNGYQSPLVLVRFHVDDSTKNLLLNVVCKAYAANIDSNDTLNRRGQTHFSLFVKS